MPASLDHITPNTPMGANLIADGATFRVWAPHADAVYILGDFNDRAQNDASLLTKDENGHWRGFIKGAKDRHRYIFYVEGYAFTGRGASECVGRSDRSAQAHRQTTPVFWSVGGSIVPHRRNGGLDPRRSRLATEAAVGPEEPSRSTTEQSCGPANLSQSTSAPSLLRQPVEPGIMQDRASLDGMRRTNGDKRRPSMPAR